MGKIHLIESPESILKVKKKNEIKIQNKNRKASEEQKRKRKKKIKKIKKTQKRWFWSTENAEGDFLLSLCLWSEATYSDSLTHSV